MLYRLEAGKIQTVAIEIAAADHCNLRCAGCSHMSPFLGSRFPEEEELARDLSALAPVLHAGDIRFVGGEPLLHPRIVPMLKIARDSGVGKRIVVFTNGLQLHRMPGEFWEQADYVRVNLYPRARPTKQLIEQARRRAAESHTEILFTEYSTFRTTMVTEPHPRDTITDMIFRTCKNAHSYQCHLVRAGWLYKCACPAYLGEYLERMGQSGYRAHDDGFDIHRSANLRDELWSFLTRCATLEACRYCLGHAGREQDHHQLSVSQTRDPRSQPVIRQTHLDSGKLVKESFAWAGRRVAEALTRKGRW